MQKKLQANTFELQVVTYVIVGITVLEVRLYVEPRPLTANGVQRHSHGIALHQPRQTLVHGHKSVAFDVSQLQSSE